MNRRVLILELNREFEEFQVCQENRDVKNQEANQPMRLLRH